jgi:hypothetical protein
MYTKEDIKLGLNVSKTTAEMRCFSNAKDAKFKVGNKVKYIGMSSNYPQEYREKYFKVTSVVEEEPGFGQFEYTLKGFPFLVWENELELK